MNLDDATADERQSPKMRSKMKATKTILTFSLRSLTRRLENVSWLCKINTYWTERESKRNTRMNWHKFVPYNNTKFRCSRLPQYNRSRVLFSYPLSIIWSRITWINSTSLMLFVKLIALLPLLYITGHMQLFNHEMFRSVFLISTYKCHIVWQIFDIAPPATVP